MDKFFSNNTFVIDEKIAAFKLSNAYKVYNGEGQEIGAIQEHKSFLRVILGLFLSDGMLPFELNILNMEEGEVLKGKKENIDIVKVKVV